MSCGKSTLFRSVALTLALIPALIPAMGIGVAACARASEELPAALQDRLDAAIQACADYENGNFSIQAGAVVRIDLDGDLQPDWVLNEHFFACSSAASLYGSTGGTLSHFMVGNKVSSMLNQGWEMRYLGRNRVLLAEVHGTLCDGYGYTPCITASVWDAEAGVWRSAAAPWDDEP